MVYWHLSRVPSMQCWPKSALYDIQSTLFPLILPTQSSLNLYYYTERGLMLYSSLDELIKILNEVANAIIYESLYSRLI